VLLAKSIKGNLGVSSLLDQAATSQKQCSNWLSLDIALLRTQGSLFDNMAFYCPARQTIIEFERLSFSFLFLSDFFYVTQQLFCGNLLHAFAVPTDSYILVIV